MRLRFNGSTQKSLTLKPTSEKETNFTLQLSAPLTTRLADSLQCRGLCYDDPDANNADIVAKNKRVAVPRKWEGRVKIPVKIHGGKISIQDTTFAFQSAYMFKVGRVENAEESDITLHVSFRVELAGNDLLLFKTCAQIAGSKFGVTIDPAQDAFQFDDNSVDDASSDAEEPAEDAPKRAAKKATTVN